MYSVPYSPEHHEALRDVFTGRIRYHNGLNTPAIGYRWREALGGGRLMSDKADALFELWAADLIDVDTQVIQCDGHGHAVRLTHHGYQHMQYWNGLALGRDRAVA